MSPAGCPGSSRTMTSPVRKTPGFGGWPGDRGRTGTRSRRARAASRPGSQHGDLGELLGRAVAVLGQPADVSQASQRPPCADEVAVDVGAVAGDTSPRRSSCPSVRVARSKSASPWDDVLATWITASRVTAARVLGSLRRMGVLPRALPQRLLAEEGRPYLAVFRQLSPALIGQAGLPAMHHPPS